MGISQFLFIVYFSL